MDSPQMDRRIVELAREHITWSMRPEASSKTDERASSDAFGELQQLKREVGEERFLAIYEPLKAMFEAAHLAELDRGGTELEAWKAGVKALNAATVPDVPE